MALATEQQGVVLADEGLRGQQEGGRESRRFPFGDSYGTCVGVKSNPMFFRVLALSHTNTLQILNKGHS